MRIYRTFIDSPLEPGTVIELPTEESKHICQVKRLGAGDTFRVLDGKGREFLAVISIPEKKKVVANIERLTRQSHKPPERTLACALTKSSQFEDMLQRAVELGMTHFQPLYTDRTVINLDEVRWHKRKARWVRLFQESLKQSERLWLPEIVDPAETNLVLKECQERNAAAIFFAERDHGRAFSALTPGSGPIVLFVGPEGGWTEAEIHRAESHGALVISLTREAILRTETAALAAMAAMLIQQPNSP